MNFASMLLRAPVISDDKPKRAYKRTSSNTRAPDTVGKYREYFSTPHSVQEAAIGFGYTIEGVASTLRRYRKAGLIVEAGKRVPPFGGRPALLWVWK